MTYGATTEEREFHRQRMSDRRKADPEKNRAYIRAYYYRTHEARLAAAKWGYYRHFVVNKERDRIRRDLLRAVTDGERARGCVDCGEKDLRVIDFDHVRGVKSTEVSRLIARGNTSVKRLLIEIDKCDPRCANCHRRVTDVRRRAAS